MTVRDPVCGMEIKPQGAFAKREHLGQIFYFCSQSCVEQFDKDPHQYVMTSATTGFNPDWTLVRIELPIADLPYYKPVPSLESGLLALNGIHNVTANAGAGVLRVEYDPQLATIPQMSAVVRSAGFQVGGTNAKIGIENLRCASCVKFIEDELTSTDGGLSATVNIATQEASVEYLPQKTTLAQLNGAIETWGYKPRPALSDAPIDKQEEAHVREYRRLMRMFWFAAIISAPVLLFAYPQYVPLIRDLSMETIRWSWVLSAIATLPVLFYSGYDFFTGAWAAFKHRSANMNTLIALGTGAAWLYSRCNGSSVPALRSVAQPVDRWGCDGIFVSDGGW